MVLLGYAHLQYNTVLIRSTAHAFLILAVAFFLAGYAGQLPVWLMRIVANLLLLFPSAVLYSGFKAYLHDTVPHPDRLGFGLVALTLPFFVWWGVVEPDGTMRSIVFSLASALLNGRIAWVLVLLARRRQGGRPAHGLALLFAVASVWMLFRTGLLLFADPVPLAQRDVNPTTWVTVFWFNVLAAAIVATLLAMERQRFKERALSGSEQSAGKDSDGSWNNLLLLWTVVIVMVLTILAEVGIAYTVLYQREYRQLQERTELANQAFVDHTRQTIGQADILLRATRGLVERQIPVADLERFILNLDFPREIIEDVFVIDRDGQVVVPAAALATGRNVGWRDYFLFHRQHSEDVLFISPVSVGQITGKHQFRLSRRLAGADGDFAGVVLVPVEPQAFTRMYRSMLASRDAIATLLGSDDKKIRARTPPVHDPARYETTIANTPLWNALDAAPQGTYRNVSAVDGIERDFIYQRVGDWPLVMLSGFSTTDVHRNTLQSIQPIGLGALLALALVLSLAVILALGIRQRETRERHLAAIREANERSSALFNASNEGVILLDGEQPVDCNPAALAMFGVPTKAEFLALSPWSPVITPPVQPDGSATPAYAQRQIETALRNGTHRFDYVHKRMDDDTIFPTEVMLTAIRFEGKTILQAVVRDITERVRHENQLKAINAALALRNEEQDRFLSMLSHELKTPLAVIRMSLGQADEGSRERIARNVADIDAIVDRCLHVDRIEHDRIQLAPVACDVAALVDRVVTASRTPQRVHVACRLPLPPCTTDAQLFGIVLSNLIDNALKYSPEESIVDLAVDATDDAGHAGIRIVVANRPGLAGMPDPEQVFNKFYRAPGAHAKTGSGLGLHIAKGLADRLGGHLAYRPAAGMVRFEWWLPC